MPTTTETPAAALVAAAPSWLKTHEKIVITLIITGLLAFGVSKYFDHAADVATAAVIAATERAKAADTAAATQAATTAQVAQQYQTMVQTLTVQNQTLAQALAARQTATAAQQKTDATLSAIDLSTRITALSNAPAASITVAGDTLQLNRPGAIAVVQALEVVPTLQANLKDETTVAANQKTELDKGAALIADQGKQITDLNLARTADAVQCKAEVTAVKAQARKDKIKWFKRGFLVGFVSGLYAGHAAGL